MQSAAQSLSWEQFEPEVRRVLSLAETRLQRQLDTADVPTKEAINITVRDLYLLLGQRGRVYGEDVLALLGETGFLVMAVTKVMRILWGYEHDQPAQEREESWIDLAGYAILCVAMRRYQNGTDEEGQHVG